jgi:quinol monooxygenase YgiN
MDCVGSPRNDGGRGKRAHHHARNPDMITEIATIDVKPGDEAKFEAGVAAAAKHFKAAKGCHGLALKRSHETPGRYHLHVTWETVEHHTVDFRASEHFTGWRNCVAAYFAAPPSVEHVTTVATYF